MQNCLQCKSEFEITDEDREYYRRIEVPEPRFCPTCRLRRRLVFRNERNYYSRPCDLCKKPIISVYDPARTKNVYCLQCWWSDKWSAKDYGRDFDFTRPFFEQYAELLREVPKLAMVNDNGVGSQNCEYTYDFAYSKNCYLMIATWRAENCMYGFQNNRSMDCIDNLFVNESQLLYNSAACEECYACQDCHQSKNSRDCIFGFDLKNCTDCILCSGLHNKQYCIWNTQYTKEEYLKKKKELNLGSRLNRERYRKEFAEFIKQTPRKYANVMKCEDSTGDNLTGCKNANECYNFHDIYNGKFNIYGVGAKDCYDCYSTGEPELCYDSITPDNSYLARWTVFCWKSQFITYSDNCHSSENLFGSVGMRQGKYAILNKSYEKEEYLVLRDKIIAHMKKSGEWGDFFPPSVTLFAYNESVAIEQCPVSEEHARAAGYQWLEKRVGAFGKETQKQSEVPDTINDINESICKALLACDVCGKNYQILKQEFEFYKKQEIPIPSSCPDCRHLARLYTFNPKKLWHRQCMCKVDNHGHASPCPVQFETTYAPDRPEVVYCEQCYQAETA